MTLSYPYCDAVSQAVIVVIVMPGVLTAVLKRSQRRGDQLQTHLLCLGFTFSPSTTFQPRTPRNATNFKIFPFEASIFEEFCILAKMTIWAPFRQARAIRITLLACKWCSTSHYSNWGPWETRLCKNFTLSSGIIIFWCMAWSGVNFGVHRQALRAHALTHSRQPGRHKSTC